MFRDARNLLGVAALFAATLVAYLPAIRAGFIWNDVDYVTAPALRSTEGLARIWFEIGATEQYYPLLHSAFWLEHKLWGDSPAGYHLINILLHAASACLLAAIVRRLLAAPAGTPPVRAADPARRFSAVAEAVRLSRPGFVETLTRSATTDRRIAPSKYEVCVPAVPTAWLAAAIFALHPVYVESVAWISEQKNTLSLVFYLAAALAYLEFDESRRARPYAVATCLFVCALLSKTTTATLPPALLVVFWWRRGRLVWQRDVRPLVPWFVLAAAMGVVSAWVERKFIGAEGAEFALTFGQRVLLAGRIVWFYLGKLVWPGDLIFIYPRWDIAAAGAGQWIFSLGTLAALGALWWWRGRWRAPLAAALFFGGSLFPVLGFFNVYGFMFSYVADHWQYLPSLGIVVLAAGGLTGLLAGRPPRARFGVPGLLLLALGALSFHQSRMYADMETFYRTTLARNPTAWMAHNNLGSLLRERGRVAEAIPHYEAAIRLRPDLPKAHYNLGNCLYDLKRPLDAIAAYQRAVACDADYLDAHNGLSRVLREAGRLPEALAHGLTSVRLDPAFEDARNNLGMTLRDLGRLPEAVAQFERALQLRPASVPPRLNLALTLSLLGRQEEAMAHYREARRLNPKLPDLQP